MFFCLGNNYEYHLELEYATILCKTSRNMQQISGPFLVLTVGPGHTYIRKLNKTFFFVSLFAGPESKNARC